ncbi:glycerophosphoryl diester phosphodiesterase membrane domain-containing protein [Pseudostreptobacillus hongkongensis]|uniref:glycerophosphoryl diester phosphodiesterase membrane domain-containing protein n=1 Tax=Pseudostreptobacillus hongkongensis TaxID=1162717 RepID=UPI00082D771D|nr:glycerophosphodiester phosphodiesterase [Pseudostreptobacillus hongkongensis]
MKRKIFGEFKEVLKNLYDNKFEYIINTSIMEAGILTLGAFVLEKIFELMMYFAGIHNVTQTNFYNILFHPVSLITLIVYILIMAFIMFFEFSFIVFMIYGKFNNKNYSVKTILNKSFNSMKSLIGKQFIFFLAYFITMIPIQNLGLNSVLTQDLYIPKFITEELLKTPSNAIIFLVAMVILIYINFRLFFVIPLTIISRKSLSDSIKESWEITKNHKLEIILIVLMSEVIFTIVSGIIVFVVIYIFEIINSSGNSLILQTLFFTLLQAVFLFFSVMSKLVIVTTLVNIIVDKNEVSNEIINLESKEKRKFKYFNTFLTIFTISLIIYNGYNIYYTGVNENVLTIAHRGDVEYGVENSLEALEGALKNKADYVEMDIVMTKDNKFVVLHDFNLKRLAGINKNIYDMNFDEVVGLEIKQGGFKSHIPSFEEYVKRAKELDVKLLVELKPHGEEPDNYVDLVIQELKRLGIDKKYKVMSLNKDVIVELNKKEPDIDTGYVIPIQFGSFNNIAVDFYVIEDFSFSNYLLREAKIENKNVFVWTINDKEDMTRYLQTAVDGIITDNPKMVNDVKKELKTHNTYFDKVARELEL